MNFFTALTQNYREHVTFKNVLLAMLIAAVITFLINKARRFMRVALRYPAELSFPRHSFKQVVERCVAMFPLETIIFRGKSFRRGMRVRITTVTKKTFEGELIGINADNVLCVIAKDFIVADTLEHVAEIVEIIEIVEK